MTRLIFLTLCLALVLWPIGATADPAAAPVTAVDSHALAPISGGAPVAFDPHKATDAYLSRVSGNTRAQSDAYFEGGYILIFVDAIYAIIVCALLLWFKVSAASRRQAAA